MFRDKRLTKRRVDAIDATLRPNGHITPLVDLEEPQSIWVWLRNDSGSDRERYECMALSDPIFDLDLDGSVDLMFKAVASDPAKTPVILIEPIANGELGRGIIHGLALAKVGTGATTATSATPGTNKLTPGSGMIKLLGKPSTTVDMLLPVLIGASDGIHYLYTLTSATHGTIRSMDDTTVVESGVAVINTLNMFGDQVSGDRGVCIISGGVYYRIQAPCKT